MPGLNCCCLSSRERMRPCGSIVTMESTLPTDAATCS